MPRRIGRAVATPYLAASSCVRAEATTTPSMRRPAHVARIRFCRARMPPYALGLGGVPRTRTAVLPKFGRCRAEAPGSARLALREVGESVESRPELVRSGPSRGGGLESRR